MSIAVVVSPRDVENTEPLRIVQDDIRVDAFTLHKQVNQLAIDGRCHRRRLPRRSARVQHIAADMASVCSAQKSVDGLGGSGSRPIEATSHSASASDNVHRWTNLTTDCTSSFDQSKMCARARISSTWSGCSTSFEHGRYCRPCGQSGVSRRSFDSRKIVTAQNDRQRL